MGTRADRSDCRCRLDRRARNGNFQQPEISASLGHAYTNAGDVETAAQILDRLAEVAATRHMSSYHTAVIHAALRDTRAFVGWSKRTPRNHHGCLPEGGPEDRFPTFRFENRRVSPSGATGLLTGLPPLLTGKSSPYRPSQQRPRYAWALGRAKTASCQRVRFSHDSGIATRAGVR